MNLSEIIESAYLPAIKIIGVKDSPEARVMTLAIGLQESRFEHRRQLVGNPPRPTGPAKSFWQAEKGGGMVHGVRVHATTSRRAALLYAARGVEPNDQALWDAIETDDVLAAGLARLLLLSDPRALPDISDIGGAWDTYLRIWRPGRPHIETWSNFHAQARREVMA